MAQGKCLWWGRYDCTSRLDWAMQWENVLKVLKESSYWSWREDNQIHSHLLSLDKETCRTFLRSILRWLRDSVMPDPAVWFWFQGVLVSSSQKYILPRSRPLCLNFSSQTLRLYKTFGLRDILTCIQRTSSV